MLEYSALYLEWLDAIAFLNEELEGNMCKLQRFVKHGKNKRTRINMSLYLSNLYTIIIIFIMYKNSSAFILCSPEISFQIFPFFVCRKYFWFYICLKFHTRMCSLDRHHIRTVKVLLLVLIRKEKV